MASIPVSPKVTANFWNSAPVILLLPADPAITLADLNPALFASIVIGGKTIHFHQPVSVEYIRLLLGL